MTDDVIIRIRGVVNRFGKQTVHDGLDLDIRRGEILGVVGGSGTGKSVLLRSIIGLHRPNAGSIEIDGQDIMSASDAEKIALCRLWGVLFQKGALFSSLTVEENICVPLREHAKMTRQQMEAVAATRLEQVGLAPEAGDKYPSELSGGMIKRAALARALALEPSILFLDEPTAGLDPIGAAAFDTLVLELRKKLGVTVVMVTHDLDSLFTICDRIAVLVDKKITVGNLGDLLDSNHPWIKDYFHGPRARAVPR